VRAIKMSVELPRRSGPPNTMRPSARVSKSGIVQITVKAFYSAAAKVIAVPGRPTGPSHRSVMGPRVSLNRKKGGVTKMGMVPQRAIDVKIKPSASLAPEKLSACESSWIRRARVRL
jgi:hypothetical protein